MNDATWNDAKKFPRTLQFTFKRARLNIQILKRPSDVHTKFDLFQRLNSGGSIATPQEVRNCAVIMADEPFFNTLVTLSEHPSFLTVTRISEKGEIKQKKLEFVMRFFAFAEYGFDARYDVEEFVDKHIVELADRRTDQQKISATFKKTFDLLHLAEGDNALRRYDKSERKFTGKVGQVALEAVAVGVARNLVKIEKQKDPTQFVSRRIRSFWSEPDVRDFSASGVSGTKRLSETVEYGEKYFAP